MNLSKTLIRFVATTTLILGSQQLLLADNGNPIAIRSWPQGVISIETQWGLTVAIADENPAAKKVADRLTPQPDQILFPSQKLFHCLSRQPNEDTPSWQPISQRGKNEPNAVYVQSIDVNDAPAKPLLITIDDLRILTVPMESVGELAKKMEAEKTVEADQQETLKIKHPDLLVLIESDNEAEDETNRSSVATLTSILNPKTVLLNGTKTLSKLAFQNIAATIDPNSKTFEVDHNTTAISSFTPSEENPKIISLTDTPWQMPADLETLFAAMDKSSFDSQDVFRKLSVDQMNFKPENGTHTPRWNAEHMMGRQLLFFSLMYQTVDPAVQAIDLNPAQMPADYEFAHANWTGAEEAQQIKRVGDFCRRFAYLLDGIAIQNKAPGTSWPSLKALLVQMDRHYHEHTDNTVKKFELPGWPEK